MRWMVLGLSLVLLGVQASVARAEEQRKSERIIGSVVTGLLGGAPQSPEATFTAQERDRLVSLLQSGEYVTSRQGETVDMMVYGIPLTRVEHVYTAKPIPPSQTGYRQSQ